MIKNLKEKENGAAAIETALILPIIIVFSFGFFEFCRVVFTQTILNHSAAEASRYAMVNIIQSSTDDAAYLATKAAEIETVARNNFILINTANISDFSVTLTPATFTTNVNVSIDYDYTTSIPMLPNYNFTLTAISGEFLAR